MMDSKPECLAVEQSTNDCVDVVETVDEIDEHFNDVLKCQREIDELGKREIEDVLKIIVPFEKLSSLGKKPLYEKRNEAIEKIPNFWPTSVTNCLTSSSLFDEVDVMCFGSLSRMSVEHMDEEGETRTGLKVDFYFEEDNPFIENSVISKIITWNGCGDRQTTSTPIIWKQEIPRQKAKLETNSLQKPITFDWLEGRDDPLSVKFMQILDLWENPLQYYLLSGETPKEDDDGQIKRSLEEVEQYQNKINALNLDMDKEMMTVMTNIGGQNEASNKLLFDKRNEIIQKIPNFWAVALTRDPHLLLILGEEEINCLKYVTNIDIEHKDVIGAVESSMTIHLHFSEDNPYIQNKVLSKTFFRGGDGERSSTNTAIIWKEGVNICKREDKAELEGSQQTREFKFFNWFTGDGDPESNSHITLLILQLWEDPLEYYFNLEDDCDDDVDDGVNSGEAKEDQPLADEVTLPMEGDD